VQYSRLACTDAFRTGIERVVRGAADQRIVLMCAEGEPLECHRAVLVARELEKTGLAVKHLLRNSKLEDHSATL
jgi:uncharacterized protein (DUF488 family)